MRTEPGDPSGGGGPSPAGSARWVAAPVPEAAAELTRAGLPDWLAPLLARRGVADRPAADRFLAPALDQLHDPYLLAGMAGAVERLMRARERHELLAVVGDYDVDGITATALLLAVLKACGVEARAILPHRLREGYGFQPVHVERARELGCRLILTVDCGSSAPDAVAAALTAGIDVVVTDHHLPGCELPPGALQINPRQRGCSYPFPDLAAVGLALKLALALAARCSRPLDVAALLRIACLGTIADLVPLRGENRVIAALGLRALGAARSQGLKALMRQSGMKPPYSAADIGYRLGPRLNAAGRLHDPSHALELLLSRDPARALELALELDDWNRQRQAQELQVVEEARRSFAERRPLPALLLAWNDSWHRGVIGVAAGRIAKELHRPTILWSVGGATATGSGRSVPGVELHGFVARFAGQLLRFGGHAQAVGMTAAAERLPELRRDWEEAAAAAWPSALLERRYEYEMEVAPREVSAELVAQLAGLEPFGQDNPRPLVRSGPLRLARTPRLFGKGHLAAQARGEDGGTVELVGWLWAERAAELAGRFEVLGHIETDSYHGGPVLRLVASRPV
ncbi:MAG TPA: single-stranded-DNA-specific exonuclease RecJ [Thermoanaerobaculia bacterium]|nr:single-stranded-DNA-specific exonuclease RecJ [Thermoanaerobaculia bacterium]